MNQEPRRPHPEKNRRPRRHIGALVGTLAAAAALLIHCPPDMPEPAAVDPLSPLQLESMDNGGILFLDSQECPEGGTDVTQSMVVQAYADNDSPYLYAIRPVREYNRDGRIEYCGPDYGAHGEPFIGKAIAITGSGTLIDYD